MPSDSRKREGLIKARQKAGQVYVSSAIGLATNKSTANLDRLGDARRDWQEAKQAVIASKGKDAKD
jgi:hypothetical protein